MVIDCQNQKILGQIKKFYVIFLEREKNFLNRAPSYPKKKEQEISSYISLQAKKGHLFADWKFL